MLSGYGEFISDKRYQSINIASILSAKLKWLLKIYLQNYWLDYLSLENQLRDRSIDLLMAAHNVSSDTYTFAALHYCDNNNIRTIARIVVAKDPILAKYQNNKFAIFDKSTNILIFAIKYYMSCVLFSIMQ